MPHTPAEPSRSHPPVASHRLTTPGDPDAPTLSEAVDERRQAVDERRQAVDELGQALRELVQTSVASEVGSDELRRVAALLRNATASLAATTRSRDELAAVDDLLGGIRMYNPVTGTGSAFAPPLRITAVNGRVEATCSLGLAYEGPPRHVHGGVSAMLLDQILGYAVAASGRPGLTRELVCRYRRPVPLQTPLYLTAGVTEIDGRTVVGSATLATLEDRSTVLVEATGTFVALRREQAARLFV